MTNEHLIWFSTFQRYKTKQYIWLLGEKSTYDSLVESFYTQQEIVEGNVYYSFVHRGGKRTNIFNVSKMAWNFLEKIANEFSLETICRFQFRSLKYVRMHKL